MTLQDIFNQIGQNPTFIILFFVGLPLVTFLALQLSQEASYDNPWRYFYSSVIYLACIPGIFSITLTIYTMLFEGKSLLNVNFFVYFLPMLSMFATLLILRSRLNLDYIPGFNKLSGLLFMIAAVFSILLLLQRTRIWVLFHGSVWFLIGIFLVLFIVFKVGWERLFR